ncbi:nuclear transport factor 2 family protein [Brevibacillus choshinensis]|uniref:Nuclear transport factor 2 family protein n=1 Tax=Brevibacillus choshinensis TaxID=54911 RepID=A0ABX7FX27_BRECH|nr:nuclear transport factor 2 family protein [Brevibacillus choshinensis]QRG70366.1 nuclear transport factor 2 family protein [Brevibacillus choshinensis]
MKPEQVLLQYFQNLKDMDKALNYVHRDAKFIAAYDKETDRHHFYGTYEGIEGVRAMLSKFQNDLDTQEFEIHKILGDEITAFAWGRFQHRIRSTDNIFESYWAVVCEVEDGKIKYFRGFEDTGALEASFRKK